MIPTLLSATKQAASVPVFGKKITTHYTVPAKKNYSEKTIIEETSYQIRAWEAGLVALIGAAGLWAYSTDFGRQSELGKKYGFAGDAFGDFMEGISFGLLQKK
jgi:hypothetical protein